jgi:hypothetical protein
MSELRYIASVNSSGDLYLELHNVTFNKGIPISYEELPFTIGGGNFAEIDFVLERVKKVKRKDIIWGGKAFPSAFKLKNK